VLKCARCSCLPLRYKKAIVTLPFLGVAIFSFYNVIDTWADSENLCSYTLHAFIITTCSLLVFDGLVAICFFFGPSAANRRVKLLLIFVCSLSGISVGIWGCVGIRENECLDLHNPHLYHTAAFLRVLVIVFNSLIFCFSICCKTEDFLDDTILLQILVEEGHPIPKHLQEEAKSVKRRDFTPYAAGK
jgi:hypothetical protein